MKTVLTGGLIVTPDYVLQGASITLENDRIIALGRPADKADVVIELKPDDIVFPALINSHDHMLGTYYPRVGSGPYINWLPWDDDLKGHPLYQERSHIANEDLYLLSAYRNLLSGVTTVSDHISHVVNHEIIPHMPVRVMTDYNLAHECSSFELRWGRPISEEHRDARKRNIPFITHIEEGFDEESTMGIDILRYFKALDEYTVLIHGIAFSDDDIDRIAEQKASVVWCPTSNFFMFKETTNIRRLLQKGVNVCLGTDSPMSGGLNMFEELQFAQALYKERYHEELDAKTLVQMVTTHPSKAFRLPLLGKLEPGCMADILVISGGDVNNPYQSLVNAWFQNVKLLMKDGQPLYGVGEYLDQFKRYGGHYQMVNINGSQRILAGKPVDLMKRIWKDVQFKKSLPFFPIEFYS